MSRSFLGNALALALVCSYVATTERATAQTAADATLQQGDPIGVFYVTKVAGAKDDGVEPGEDLCYRCRYGSSPMVMIFTRGTGGNVAELVKKIDTAVAENEDSRLKGLLILLGEDASKLKEDANKIALKADVKYVPVVIAKETKTGPLNYKLPSDSAVTIVVAKDSQVVAMHSFAADMIDISAILNDVRQMLN